MQLEAGKFYCTRDGLKVRIYATDGAEPYPAHGALFNDGICLPYSWTLNGEYDTAYTEHRLDIFSEWVEKPEVNWSEMPEGATCIAKGKDGKWRAYKQAPSTDWNTGWVGVNGEVWLLYPQHCPSFTCDWKDSLVQRPV